jgi:hypothetical protein
MYAITEDTELIRHAPAYVTELFERLTTENRAPPLGAQNQVVDLILANPQLSATVIAWGRHADTDTAKPMPRRRLPQDAACRRVRASLRNRDRHAPGVRHAEAGLTSGSRRLDPAGASGYLTPLASSPSSRGPGHRPLTAATPVRIR